MNQFKTRCERLYHQQKLQRQKIKRNLSLVGVALSITPAVATIVVPETAAAAEYGQAQNSQAFIEQLGASAMQVAASNDLYASIMVAQALLESGFGSSTLSKAPNYNLFGVKEYGSGSSVQMNTKEYLNGQWVTMNEPFAQYNSYYESFVGHVGVLASSNYAGAWKSHTYSYQDAANYLTGRYATAPNYGTELIKLIQGYNLTRFDTPGAGSAVQTTTQTTTTSVTASTTTGSHGTYTVQAGDSFYSVAQTLGISVDQLLAANGKQLTDTIHAGHQLAY